MSSKPISSNSLRFEENKQSFNPILTITFHKMLVIDEKIRAWTDIYEKRIKRELYEEEILKIHAGNEDIQQLKKKRKILDDKMRLIIGMKQRERNSDKK